MAITVGEVTAILTARDSMSEVMKKAEQGVKDLEQAFKTYGGNATASLTAAESSVESFAASLKPAGVAMLGFAGIAVTAGAALFGLAEQSAAAGAHLQDISETLGVAVPAVSRLSNAATVAGTDMSTLNNAMFMLQKTMELSPDKFEQGLKRIGINFGEFKAMSPDQELLTIATALKATEDPVQRTAAGYELMGRQYRELAPAILKMNDALAMTADIQPWTKEQAEAAEAFEMQLTSLKVHAEALGISIGRELLAPMSEFLGLLKAIKPAFDNWTGGFGGVLTPIHALTEAFGYASAAVEVFRGTAQETAPAVDALTKQQEALNAAFDAAHTPDADVKAWKDSVEALIPHMVTLDEALATQKEIMQDLDPSTKTAITSGLKWAQVMDELNSVGDGWRGTLAEMNGTTVEAIRYYLAAGVSQGTLAEAYGLTATQIKAVAHDLRDENEQLKQTAAATERVTLLWDEFNQMASSGGTAFDQQIAAIDRWAEDLEAKAQKAGTDTADFYDALTSLWTKKLNDASHDAKEQFALQDEYSRASFEKRASDAKAAYDMMMADSSNYTNEEIRQAEARMKARAREAESWTSGVTDALTKTAAAGTAVADAFAQGIAKMKEMETAAAKTAEAVNKALGYNVDVNYQNFEGMIEYSTAQWGGTWGTEILGSQKGTSSLQKMTDKGQQETITAIEAAKEGYSFQEIVTALKGSPLGPHPGGPRIPGFEGGGPTGSGGIAMLHPDEYVVPRGGALVMSGSGSSPVIHLTVQGSVYTMDPAGKAAFAQHISDALLPLFRQGRQWPSA